MYSIKNETMKLKSPLLVLILGILIYGCSNSDLDILQKTNNKLQKMTTVQYQTEYKNFNPKTGQLGMNDSAIVFFDFRSKDTIIGAKYLFTSSKADLGFNGSTSFFTIKERKQLAYNQVKSYNDLVGFGFRTFSIQNLRFLLPQLLNDTAIFISRSTDTIINNSNCYRFAIKMNGKTINRNGRLVSTDNADRSYVLITDKKNNLPKQFISYTKRKSPNWIVSYNNFDLSIAKNDSEFDYALRDSDYVKYTMTEFWLARDNETILKNSIFLGMKASEWKLPSMAGDSVSLSKINANLILLEFWFPYCAGCAAAIPDINEIQKSYKHKGLHVYGIEFTKADSIGLTDYIAKMGINYSTLFSGKKVAINYGVSAGPSVFLINKAGKFVYARTGFIKEEVIKAIDANLN